MAYNILVVEDLETSRTYLQTLLETEGHDVVTAENGIRALDQFRENRFDMVITDLKMPEMDGLGLIRSIRAIDLNIPVIVISAYSELDDVIESLRLGASNYIVKPCEEEQIINSIHRAARIIQVEVEFRHSLQFMTEEMKVFQIDSDPALIDMMARSLCRNLALLDLKKEMQGIQISLIEALSNAIFHGNLEISSTLKKGNTIKGFIDFNQLAERKKKRPPFDSRKVTIRYYLNDEMVSFVIADEGPGFDFHRLPDPLDPENFIRSSGRGLLMIRTFCDEVSWNDKGNEITLIKYRQGHGIKGDNLSKSEG